MFGLGDLGNSIYRKMQSTKDFTNDEKNIIIERVKVAEQIPLDQRVVEKATLEKVSLKQTKTFDEVSTKAPTLADISIPDNSLALDPYSATSIYIAVLPTIESIKSLPLTDADKLLVAKKIVYKSVKKAREDCDKDKTRTSKRNSIGPLYVEKLNEKLHNIKDMDDLIDYLHKAIKKGTKILTSK